MRSLCLRAKPIVPTAFSILRRQHAALIFLANARRVPPEFDLVGKSEHPENPQHGIHSLKPIHREPRIARGYPRIHALAAPDP